LKELPYLQLSGGKGKVFHRESDFYTEKTSGQVLFHIYFNLPRYGKSYIVAALQNLSALIYINSFHLSLLYSYQQTSVQH
jgi:hypothetical protein